VLRREFPSRFNLSFPASRGVSCPLLWFQNPVSTSMLKKYNRWISTTVSMISCWQQKADRTFSTRTSFPRVQDGLSYCIRTNVDRALPRTPFSSDGSTLLFLSLPPSPSSVNYARVLYHGREEALETRVGALGRFISCGEGASRALTSMRCLTAATLARVTSGLEFFIRGVVYGAHGKLLEESHTR
jgi:hypothetical protein